jgi:hypothetical protein
MIFDSIIMTFEPSNKIFDSVVMTFESSIKNLRLRRHSLRHHHRQDL